MKLHPLDLVLRFDPTSNEVLLLVPSSPDKVEALKRFFAVPVPDEVTVSEFASEIGVTVASFLHARHGDRFKLIETESGEDHLDEPTSVAFEDARLLIDRIGDDSTIADLQAIDVLLEHASNQGNDEATRYLVNTWPRLRAVFVRRLSRN